MADFFTCKRASPLKLMSGVSPLCIRTVGAGSEKVMRESVKKCQTRTGHIAQLKQIESCSFFCWHFLMLGALATLPSREEWPGACSSTCRLVKGCARCGMGAASSSLRCLAARRGGWPPGLRTAVFGPRGSRAQPASCGAMCGACARAGARGPMEQRSNAYGRSGELES